MRLADLLKKKNQKVLVRVPAQRQEEFGGNAEVRGTVIGVVPGGASVAWVEVKVPRRGTFKFRPQDLTLA